MKIHWYAIMYLLAFALAYFLMIRRLRHEPFRSITRPEPWTKTDVEDILLGAILGVLIGGRLGYCLFYQPAHYLTNPLDILKVWDGGMSFHGGAIGVALGLAWYAWKKKRPFLQVADFLVPAAPIGLAAGRFGNFINGELWGREAPAGLPWAMIFPTGGDVPRHPSQLYQMLLEGSCCSSCSGSTPASRGSEARWRARSSSGTASSGSSPSSGASPTPTSGCSASGSAWVSGSRSP
nr:prolipoprotein diacylglyceryl transferase [Tessaracoccus coleopterorum]